MPIDVIRDWIELLLALIGASYIFWNWLIKPLKKDIAACEKAAGDLKDIVSKNYEKFRKESHELRTGGTSALGRIVQTEYDIGDIQKSLARIEESQKESRKIQDATKDELAEVNTRLSLVESDIKRILKEKT